MFHFRNKQQEIVNKMERQHLSAMELYNRYSNQVTVIMATQHQAAWPSIATMLEWLQDCYGTLYTMYPFHQIYYFTKYISMYHTNA